MTIRLTNHALKRARERIGDPDLTESEVLLMIGDAKRIPNQGKRGYRRHIKTDLFRKKTARDIVVMKLEDILFVLAKSRESPDEYWAVTTVNANSEW